MSRPSERKRDIKDVELLTFLEEDERNTIVCCNNLHSLNTLASSLKKALVKKNPNAVFNYIELLNQSQSYSEQAKTFLDKLELWKPNNIYQNLELISELSDSPITIESYMNWLSIEENVEDKIENGSSKVYLSPPPCQHCPLLHSYQSEFLFFCFEFLPI